MAKLSSNQMPRSCVTLALADPTGASDLALRSRTARRAAPRAAAISLSWLALAALLPASQAQASDLNAMIDRWCSAQTNIHTWTTSLTQTRNLKVLVQPLVSPGKVWVVMPNKFRWELGQPPQTIALRQPDQLMLIYPKLKRAEKYSLADPKPGPWKDALALLDASFPKNRSELDSRFVVQSMQQTNSIVELTLQPKSAAARKFVASILITFSTNDFAPRATELRFGDGSSMRNDFTNCVLNQPIPDNLFESNLGSGFKIIQPMEP